MHKMVCIKVSVKPEKTQKITLAEVMQEGEYAMYEYCVGHYTSWEKSGATLRNSLFTKEGKRVQACRSIDFDSFNTLPDDLIFNTYIDSYIMSKYHVDWKTVLQREIQDAIDEDEDSRQIWFICYYVNC